MFGRRCVALGRSIARFLGAERARFLHAPDGPERVRISPRVSHTELTQWVMPSDTGVEGLTQGGVVMSWIDICAAIAARRVCGVPAVTASMDALDFRQPLLNGDIVTLRSWVNRIWNSSMEVEVEVLAETLGSSTRRHCVSAFLTFVALGPDGKHVTVPNLVPETVHEQRAWEAAFFRRQTRLENSKHQPPVVSSRPSGKAAQCVSGTTPCSSTYVETHRVVLPPHANSYGTAFGGKLMAWMEDLASVSACRHARQPCVTVRVDDMHFKKPAMVGDLCVVQAQANRAFNTSLEVGVRLLAQQPGDETARLCAEATMVFAVSPRARREGEKQAPDAGKPLLSDLVPATPEEQRRWEQAGLRRMYRLKEREARELRWARAGGGV